MEWDQDIRDPSTTKGLLAEFVACIGPELVKDVALDFSR